MSAPEKMSDEQIAGVLGFSVMTPNAIAYLAMGRAIEAARDAQWQAKNAALAAEVDRLQSMLNNADCEWQARLDAAVMAEREACAEFVDKHGHPNDWPSLGRAIRTRTT